MQVNGYFARLRGVGFVRMPQNKAIHTVYHIAELFSTVYGRASRTATACAVGYDKSIGGVL